MYSQPKLPSRWKGAAVTSSFPGTPQAPDWTEGDDPHVIWTRGSGCASLAALLGGDRTHRVDGDLRTACIQERADLLVTRKHSSFDLIDVAVPHHFVPERISNVVAAVAGGPHSSLAARVAGGVASGLGVPGRIVTASPSEAEDAGTQAILDGLPSSAFALSREVVRASTARSLVESFPSGTLLVLGAPGGSWMQRQFFGQGRKLLYSASGGAVIVRSAPRRCFQAAGPVTALGAEMRVSDAELIVDGRPVVPVAEAGRLVGIVRVEALVGYSPNATIGEVMESPAFVHVDDPVEDSAQVSRFLDGGAVPVIDRGGVLFGEIARQPTPEDPDGIIELEY